MRIFQFLLITTPAIFYIANTGELLEERFTFTIANPVSRHSHFQLLYAKSAERVYVPESSLFMFGSLPVNVIVRSKSCSVQLIDSSVRKFVEDLFSVSVFTCHGWHIRLVRKLSIVVGLIIKNKSFFPTSSVRWTTHSPELSLVKHTCPCRCMKHTFGGCF
jgi:hypothetical protein